MRIAVLGAGPVGLTVAADLWQRGHSVALWNRSEAGIAPFAERRIRLDGAVDCEAEIDAVTTDMAEALAGAALVIVCVPASAHEDVARTAAPFLDHRQAVVLVPGRTFGALSFARTLHEAGVKAQPAMAETQTTPFSCRRRSGNQCHVFSAKSAIAIAALDRRRRTEIEAVLAGAKLDVYEFGDSTLITSMNSISPLMHCPTMLLNVSLVDANAEWARKLRSPTKFYSEFITPRIAFFIEQMDKERMAICAALGLGEKAESIRRWGLRTYGMEGMSFYEALQQNRSYGPIESPDTLDHRYLTEDVPTGLVPWESLGRSLGVPTPLTTLMIELAQSLLERDFRKTGRSLENLGFASAHDLAQHLAS